MSAPQLRWSPTAEDFTRHQLSHVTNFWRQGRQAEFRLTTLPSGQAKLCLTFELPSASESIPPPFSPPRNFVRSPFPQGYGSNPKFTPTPSKSSSPQGPGSDPKLKPTSPKKVSSRRRKNYCRSVLHRAALAASSLPPPKNGSLRQAALACVQRLQAASVLPVTTSSARKRPLPSSPTVFSHLHCSPLAQRIRADFQIGENEVESPEKEKEVLRSHTSPKNLPSPSSPCVKGLPPPAPLAFTPPMVQEVIEIPELAEIVEVDEPAPVLEIVKEGVEKPSCSNCDAEMTHDHQCETIESDSSWEDVENDQDLYPTLDVESEDWDEKFTNSIRRYHGIFPN